MIIAVSSLCVCVTPLLLLTGFSRNLRIIAVVSPGMGPVTLQLLALFAISAQAGFS